MIGAWVSTGRAMKSHRLMGLPPNRERRLLAGAGLYCHRGKGRGQLRLHVDYVDN